MLNKNQNMKKHGHTWTLFLQNWKYYKWSYKFDNCTVCRTCKFKHKWNWLCIGCYDKQRKVYNPKRIINLKKQQLVNYFRGRINLFLNKTEKSKRWRKKFLTEEAKIQYKKEWYNKNLEKILIDREVKKRLRDNKPCLKMIINWKDIFMPFESLEKPVNINWSSWFSKEWYEWKENSRKFEILKKHYIK